MNKKEIAAFFDRMAPEWDANMIKSDEKINFILDAAGVKENSVVLDVACGTGVMFPYYLARGAERVIGVDISAQMARIAASKMHDQRVEVIRGDVEEIPVERLCDCCVVYNAFPHFESPERLVERLSHWLKSGGRLTVAHGMSREKIDAHHHGSASKVSMGLMPAEQLAGIFGRYLDVTAVISDEDMYQVAGKRR